MLKQKKRTSKQLQAFLSVYQELDTWMELLGFIQPDYATPGYNSAPFLPQSVRNIVVPLTEVEEWYHPILDKWVFYVADRNEHQIVMILGYSGEHSTPISIAEFKGAILHMLQTEKEKRIKSLEYEIEKLKSLKI